VHERRLELWAGDGVRADERARRGGSVSGAGVERGWAGQYGTGVDRERVGRSKASGDHHGFTGDQRANQRGGRSATSAAPGGGAAGGAGGCHRKSEDAAEPTPPGHRSRNRPRHTKDDWTEIIGLIKSGDAMHYRICAPAIALSLALTSLAGAQPRNPKAAEAL